MLYFKPTNDGCKLIVFSHLSNISILTILVKNESKFSLTYEFSIISLDAQPLSFRGININTVIKKSVCRLFVPSKKTVSQRAPALIPFHCISLFSL